MGRIGKAIAKRAEAFDCEISYHSRNKKDVKYQFYNDLNKLAKEVNTLCVITPGGKETEKLINKDVFDFHQVCQQKYRSNKKYLSCLYYLRDAFLLILKKYF